MTFGLSQHFQSVTGIDLSMAFIEVCSTLQRRRAVPYALPGTSSFDETKVKAAIVGKRLCPERCNFLCVDAMEFLQTGAKFDLILACNVLCRLSQPRDWLAMLPKCLAPEGVVVLVNPYAWLEAWTVKEDWLGHSSEESSTTLNNIMMRLSKVGWILE
eukprot:symbB.v1.2.030332.t1/scaffold3406.1/size57470/4